MELSDLAGGGAEATPQLGVDYSPDKAGDAARSAIYALLARLFGYPKGEGLELLGNGGWLQQLQPLVANLPYPLSLPEIEQTSAGSIAATYSRLFDVAHGLPKVSVLERRYGEIGRKNNGEKKLWESLLRFYSHFGLEFAQSAAEGGPDHLVNQLEFMHYLSFLQCGSGDSGGDYWRGQRDFLQQHLGRWGAQFAEQVVAEPDSGPYGQLGAWLSVFLEAELAYLQVGVEQTLEL